MKVFRVLCSVAVAGLVALATVACGGGVEEVSAPQLDCEQDPCDYRFPPEQTGREAEAFITLRNLGDRDLEIDRIELVNTSERVWFSDSTVIGLARQEGTDWRGENSNREVRGSTPYIIAPGESLQLELTYRPLTATNDCPSGDFNNCGQLELYHNDRSADDPLVAPIRIQRAVGRIDVSPTVIDFPSPTQGVQEIRTFTVANNGSGPLNVETAAIQGGVTGLSLTNDDNLIAPFSMAAGARTQFTLRWTPVSEEDISTQVLIEHDVLDQAAVFVAVRSGDAPVPTIDVTPSDELVEASITVGSTTSLPFRITNTGAGILILSSMNVDNVVPGDAASELSVVDDAGIPVVDTVSIASNTTRDFALEFTPTTDRSVTANLSISSNDPANSLYRLRVFLGPDAPVAQVVPPRMFWPFTDPGTTDTRTFVVYNDGRAELNATNLRFTDIGTEHQYSFDDSDFTVAAGSSHAFDVTYERPTGGGGLIDTGTIGIDTNSPGQETLSIQLRTVNDTQFLEPDCVIIDSPASPTLNSAVTVDASDSAAAAGLTELAAFPMGTHRACGKRSTYHAGFRNHRHLHAGRIGHLPGFPHSSGDRGRQQCLEPVLDGYCSSLILRDHIVMSVHSQMECAGCHPPQ